MGKIETGDFADLMLSMEEIASLPDSVLEDMIDAEADVMVKGVQASARAYGVNDTGLTIASIKKGTAKRTSNGISIYVYPHDSRTRHHTTTRNAEIAFINEYGKRGQPARPFVKSAAEKYADEAVKAAEEVYDDYLKSLNL